MKKIVFCTILLLLVTFSYAQFGGGTGTIIDPYKIYSKSHLEELHNGLISGNSFTNIYFDLMNDINDSLRLPIGKNEAPFNGHFYGNGHNIVLAIDLRDSIQYSYSEYCLFPKLNASSYLDSLSISGYIFAVTGFVGYNYGVIANLTNNLSVPYNQNEFSQYVESIGSEIHGAGICFINHGIIENCINNCEIHGNNIGGICLSNDGELSISNCVNNANLIFYNNIFSCSGGGVVNINNNNFGLVNDCKNNGNFIFMGNEFSYNMGGVVGLNFGIIENCTNIGNISGKVAFLGGICGFSQGGEISNCANFGSINGQEYVAGIGLLSNQNIIKDCLNSGTISGNNPIGAIAGFIAYQDSVSNCLNIGRTDGSAIMDSINQQTFYINSNFYDKQMCLSKGIADEDFPGSAEGKLTTQLTGTSSELQTMLGDGWSYAEGRYPIPLGLENDSMALVAATPIYLYAENESNYNQVDSVTKNFTVGLQNNVAWTESNGRVSIENENVTLLNVGVEKLIVSLGEYEKEVRINIEDTEVATPQAIISNDISVYPNPACQNITVNIKGNSGIKLQIVDFSGKNVAQTINTGEVNTIDISHLMEGMYFLQIFENGNVIYTQKIIKQE